MPPQPPTGGGGGGTDTSALPYGVWQPFYDENKRLVKITVRMGKKTWVEEYIVDKKRADVIVKIMNLINKWKARAQVSISAINMRTKSAVKVGVDSLKNVLARVTAQMRKKD